MPEVNLIQLTGLNANLLIVLASFPVVATLAGVARHIIGIKSLSVYAPIILTYSFFALSLTGEGVQQNPLQGLLYGLFFVLIVILAALFVSQILKYSRMHYFPKISLVLSTSVVALLFALVLMRKIGNADLQTTNILSLVMLASIAEQFTATMFKKQARTALLLTVESLFTSIIAYYLISWQQFQDNLLKYPYLILLCFLVSFLVGKYRGLRFLEYIRFSELFKISEPANE